MKSGLWAPPISSRAMDGSVPPSRRVYAQNDTRKRRRKWFAGVGIIHGMRFTLLLAALCAAAAYAACPDLASKVLPHTTIQSAAAVTGGEVTIPTQQTPLQNLPKFCRVTGTIRPSEDSDIRFEVWLPDEADWN